MKTEELYDRNVAGEVDKIQMEFLYSERMKLGEGNSLEIGVYYGASLIYLAAAQEEIGSGLAFGICPWGRMGEIDRAVDYSTFEEYIKTHTVDLRMWINPIIGKSGDIRVERLLNLMPVQILFIDANHNSPNPYNDFLMYRWIVPKGGKVIFHDLGGWDIKNDALKALKEVKGFGESWTELIDVHGMGVTEKL